MPERDFRCRTEPARIMGRTLVFALAERELRVHSAFDPEQEARRLCDTLPLHDAPLLVIIGGGLGYLARAAASLKLAGIVTLEPTDDQLAALRDPNTAGILLQGEAETLLGELMRLRLEMQHPDIVVVHNPAYHQVWPEWSAVLLSELPPGRMNSLFRHSRNSGPWQGKRVLVLQSGYFLLRECITAFRENECEVYELPLDPAGASISPSLDHRGVRVSADFLERLLEAIETFKPEFVFCVNHIGFDRQGRLLDLLDSLRLPLAVWYVDSPAYILDEEASVARDSSFLFCWERAWIPLMEERGFGRVMHLPLAGNASFLNVRPDGARTLSFVGGSNTTAIAKWRRDLAPPTYLRKEIGRLRQLFMHEERGLLPEELLERKLHEFPRLKAWLDSSRRRKLCSLLVLEATQSDRLRLLQELRDYEPVLHGDAGWHSLDAKLRALTPLDYYAGLAEHYAGSLINLNCTSRQMPTALNQRAFDVPLAGSLVLGDAQPDLELLFTPGKDCVAWHSVEEASELCARLLRDTDERTRIVSRARETVMSRHLYRHRIADLLAFMKRELGVTVSPNRSVTSNESNEVTHGF